MVKISFLAKVMKNFSCSKMFDTINLIHERSGKNKLLLFCDITACGIKYGCGYHDYRFYEFEKLTREQRKTYVTRGYNNRLVKALNDPKYFHVFDNKNEFNETFSEFMGRKWLNVSKSNKDDFYKFIEGIDTIIAKPLDGMCGKGIEKIKVSDYKSTDSLYDYITKNNFGIIEECLSQHAEMSRIYPHSVNTLRIVTIFNEGKSNIVYAFIRIGNNGAIVDNINSGGMCAPIDVDTGIITLPAYDKDEKVYTTHPETGTKIVGFKIPFWKEACELCKKATKVVPQIGYVGWDICVTPNGPVFVEGNSYPGHDILQLPPHVPNKIGMLPRFKELISDF